MYKEIIIRDSKAAVAAYDTMEDLVNHVKQVGENDYFRYMLPYDLRDMFNEETIEGADAFLLSKLDGEADFTKEDLCEELDITGDDQEMEILSKYPDDEIIFSAKYFLDSRTGQALYLIDVNKTYNEVLMVVTGLSDCDIFYINNHLYVLSY